MRAILIGLLLLIPLVPSAHGVDSSALINEALDKTVKLQVDGVLPHVIKAIEDQTGVPIRPDPSVYELLPWGDQTNVSARIENQTLRQALSAISRKLGLTFDLGQEAIRLQPMPALARLGKRATVQELGALDLLTSMPLNLPTERPTVRQLVDAIDQKLVELKSSYAVEFRPGDVTDKGPSIKQDAAVNVPRNSTMADALESLVKDTGATWYPWGRNIVIVPKETLIRMQLNKPITAQFNSTDVQQVLADLSKQAGVEFRIEPGALQRVPSEFRTIKLIADNTSVRQVLDSISGFTGLNYVVQPDGVYIWNENPNPAAAAGAGGNHVIAMYPLGNGMQLLIRERDLPDDLRRYAEQQKEQAIQRLEKKMHEGGLLPATQPASQPAEKHEDL